MFAIVLELLGWIAASIFKFLVVPFFMIYSKHNYNFVEIVFIHSSGGALGVFIFYNFGKVLFNRFQIKKPKKKFSKWRRFIISTKNRYGIKGLMLISGIISVPFAALLASRYFRSNTTMAYLIMGFFCWSILLTGLAFGLKYFFPGNG